MYKLKLILIIAIFFCCLQYSSVYAKNDKKYVVITINTATLEDLVSNCHIRNIAENGIIGLMNVRSNGKNNQFKSYLTLGSGQRAEVSSDCLQFFVAYKDVISLYENITLNTCKEGNIVNPWINKIISTNSNISRNVVPGMLGSFIRDSGYRVGLIGGFWYNNSIKSPAFFIAMDKNGVADIGSIDGVFENNRISASKVLEAYNNYKNKADFIVVELGDIESLYANKKLYSEYSYNINKQKSIEKSGEIIDLIKKNTDFSNTILCIISPYSVYNFEKNIDILSPIIIYDGGNNKGIVTSQTTRREGIISAFDFAPSILKYYDIDVKGLLGYPIKYIPLNDNVNYILKLNGRTTSMSIYRGSILKTYAILIIFILCAFTLNAVIKKIKYIFLEWGAYFLLLVPFSMLLEGAFGFTNVFYKLIFIIFLNFILTFIIFRLYRTFLNRIICIATLLIGGLIFDVLWYHTMLKYSLLSYDPIIGARFYGIGNEFMGVMVGCSLIFSESILQKNKNVKPLVLIFLLFTVLLIGLPQFGANVGGLITASFGFLSFILLEYRCNIKTVFKISSLGCVTFLVLIIIINIIFKDSKSHLYKMIELAFDNNGIAYVMNMFQRKLSMALRLIRYTIWSKVLIVMIITFLVVIIRSSKYINNIVPERFYFKNSFIAAVIASLIAIISNDSGIVTAAFVMLYSVFTMIMMAQNK